MLFWAELESSIFATTALVMSAGVAAADVAVTGDGRMGIIDDFAAADLAFTSRIRITFTASGETDHGLSFGGTIRADNAGQFRNAAGTAATAAGVVGSAGSVFIAGDFGRITMGDTNGAAEAAVGDVRGVGLTGLGDLNEATYLSNAAANRPTMRYDYTIAGFGVHLSAENPAATAADTTNSIAFTFNLDGLRLGLGFETRGDDDHIILGGTYTIAGVTLAANYGEATGAVEATQTSFSAAYTMDALTVSAFYSDSLAGRDAYGLGGIYDLGGGASLRGGWVKNQTADQDAFDFGVNFTF